MGVASGRFCPLPAYDDIRPQVLVAWGDVGGGAPSVEQTQAQELLIAMLSVRAADGTVLAPCSHVYITDYSRELGPEGIEIAICGLASEMYSRYFPEHIERYERHSAS